MQETSGLTDPETWTPERLRLWRTGLELTLEEAAKLIGVSQATLSRWENSVVDLPHWLPAVMARVVADIKKYGGTDL